MNQPEKRIVITEVYGGCRNLRITDEGTYCAAYIHGGWEKIEPDACDHCQREKYLSGISKKEAVEKMAIAIFEKDNVLALDIRFDELAESKRAFYRSVAKAVLNALLDK